MIKEVNIFKAGTQTSAQGVTREFTKNDLQQIADSYDPGVHEAPIRIGHEDNDKVPAWGWVKGVKVKGDELYAEIDFSPLASDYIQNGLYKKVSASFYSPDSKINPEPGKWSLRHVALLGAQPPAVKGLKGFAYEESADGVFEFATALKLSAETVFDDELGPTLKRDLGPLELLKEKLDEARSQMTPEELSQEQQQLEAPEVEETAPEGVDGEFAEHMTGTRMAGKKKPSLRGGKMGTEGEDEETDEDGDSVMSKEMEGKNLPEALKKNAAKKMAKSRGISEEEAMEEGCGPRKKMAMAYEEDDEQHGEATADRDGKNTGLKAPPAKGMSDMDPETVDGEGPGASKVKKNAKSGAPDPELATEDEKYGEPTNEPAKQKRGTDHLNASDDGVKATKGGPGGLVRTKSTSKGINLGDALEHEEIEDEDDEQHVETDNNKYVDRAKLYKIKKGADGMVGHKHQDPYDDQSGRGLTGKAGVSGETGRGGKGVSGVTGETGRFEKGSDGGEMAKNYKGTYTGKSSQQTEERGMTGKAPEIKGYPANYMDLGSPKGGGKQIKGGNVRVMEINHSEADPLAALMARLEELEAANRALVEKAEFSERQLRRSELEGFVEGLYESGKLTDAVVPASELVEYMEGLEYGTLEFSEGESAATPLMRILENLPSMVCYSEVAGGETPLRDEDLDPHEKAVKMVKEQGIDYAEAIKAVLFSAE